MKGNKNACSPRFAVLATVVACVLSIALGSCSQQQQDTGEYDTGYEAGYAAGKQEAYDAGYEAGHQEGYDAGYDDGHDEGYREGHYDGEEEGREAGYRSAVDDLAGGDVSQEYYPDKTPDDLGIGTSQSYTSADSGTKTTPSTTGQLTNAGVSQTVYVSRKGKIHSIPNCSGMKYYTEMTYQAAVAAGYEFCSNCF